ncbi:MAG: hypothetical protein JO111_10305 [Caulobacteraceae bacterium]|nr:hypothetical protein [Caulobacteraceae bacterium]
MRPSTAWAPERATATRAALGRRIRVDPAIVALAALLVVTAAAKFVFAASHPLSLDELWTGSIAAQRSFAGFVRDCYLDVNAPLAYLVDWIWTRFAGLSDQALRFPSVVFASAAPLLALVPSRAVPLQVRLIWAAILACWIPGFVFAAEARSYALLLFIGTGSTIAYARLLEEPSLKSAFAWTTASSLLILTHYMSLPLVACQGLGFLLAHRLRAVRAWPSLLAFLPALASLAVHSALLVSFSGRGPAGAAPLRVGELPELVAFVFGGRSSAWILLAWGVASLAIYWLRRDARAPQSEGTSSLAWVVPASSIAAVALCLTVSLAHPLVIDRYLTSMAPGVLLAVALAAHRLARGWRLAPAALVALQFGLVVGLLPAALHPAPGLNLEEAWSYLKAAGVQRLAFFWDSPTAAGGNPDAFAQVGGFLFHREGRPLAVTALIAKPGEDPNPVLALADRRPGAGILWLDQGAAASAARRYPPRIQSLDAAWRCHEFGSPKQHVLACVRPQAR